MVLFNYSTRELTAKIVYYGPGLCGKTTNLQYIYDSLPDNVKKGKMLSLATKTDRTLFFDFLPIELGKIRGMKTRVQLYTVPGQVFYNSTRKLVLKGADGVVFVADSQSKMIEANVESYKNLDDNLREMGLSLEETPLVMQFNKRDLPNLSAIEEMNTQINRHNAPFYEAVATTGIGVEDTLKAITKLVLNSLAAKYKLDGAIAEPPGPRAAEPAAPRPVPAPSRPAPSRAPAAGPRPLPEDLALDALTSDAPVPSRPSAVRAPAGARGLQPPLRSVPVAAAAEEEIIELDEEIDLSGTGEPPDGTIDLGSDLLAELEEDPAPAPRAGRPGPRSAGQGASPPRAEAVLDPIELDDPLELEGSWTPSAGAEGALDLGHLSAGDERTVDVPVQAVVDGRPVRLKLRLTLRLTR